MERKKLREEIRVQKEPGGTTWLPVERRSVRLRHIVCKSKQWAMGNGQGQGQGQGKLFGSCFSNTPDEPFPHQREPELHDYVAGIGELKF